MPRFLRRALQYTSNSVARHPRALLLLLAAFLTLGMQYWVGGATVYRSEFIVTREALHSYILRNEPPPGQSWMALGAHSLNIRIGIVYFAEALHRTTGAPLYFIYKAIDTGALLGGMLLFYVFIAQWAPRVYALLAFLYLAAVTPLTYFLHVFHPWDRPALAAWLICLILLRAQRLVLLTFLLPIAVAIKFDIVLFPVLYFLACARRETWRTVAVRTLAMLAMTFGMYFVLRVALPGGFDSQRTAFEQIAKNVREFAAIPLFYPPLLALGLPFVVGLVGWKHADRFARACWLFAFVLTITLFIKTNFQELRAEMPVLLLLMPCAVLGTRIVLEGTREPSKSVVPESIGIGG